MQLLLAKIPKTKKIQSSCQSFVLLGSAQVNSLRKMLMKMIFGVNFTKFGVPSKNLPAHIVWQKIRH